MATDATVKCYEQQQAVTRVSHLVRVVFTLTGEQHARNSVTDFMCFELPMKRPWLDIDLLPSNEI